MVHHREYGSPASQVAVTGGAGFIGSAVVRLLESRGQEARVMIGPDDAAPLGPRAQLATRCDIGDLQAVSRFVAGAEAVIHLAGPSSVSQSFHDPVSYSRVHSLGTRILLSACAEECVKRLVLVSSAEVYGQPRSNPVAEDHPLAPRSPYGAAKAAAEIIAKAALYESDLQLTILRPFIVYGHGMRQSGVFFQILRQALQADSIRIADAKVIRDFCYVDDVARAIVSAVGPTESTKTRIYNIGSSQGTSIGALAHAARCVVGRNIPIESSRPSDRPRSADIRSMIADTRCVSGELGWSAETALPEGLRRTLAPMRQHQQRRN